MEFTNGYNPDVVLPVLLKRIGWKQPTIAEHAVVDTNNQISKSGRYYNDGSFHPLVTIPNIKNTIEDSGISDVDFNVELEQIAKSAIISCLSTVFNKSELIEQSLLFESRYSNTLTERPNAGKFVGFRIKVAPGHVLQINKLSLLFNGVGNLNISLYHERKSAALWSTEVILSEGEPEIVTPDEPLFISNVSDTFLGGYFFLGYFQDELQDIKAIEDNEVKSCLKCARIEPIESIVTDGNFNRQQFGITGSSYGLNLDISVFKDYTDSIIKGAHLFDNAIGLQVAYNVSKNVLFAIRSNVNERILKDQMDKFGLAYELDGKVPISDVPKTFGLQDKINTELKKVRASFCPPFVNKIVNYA